MNHFQTLFISFAIAAAPLMVGSIAASAQEAPIYRSFDPPRATSPQRQTSGGNVIARAQLVRKMGVVQGYLYSGRRVRGVRLTDGTRVLLGTNRWLSSNVRPGAVVRVHGFVTPSGDRRLVRQAAVVALRSSGDARTAYVRPAPPRPAAGVSDRLSTEATVISVVRSPSGRPHTLVLSNGYSLVLPPSMAMSLASRDVVIGEAVSFEASSMSANPSNTLIARIIRFSDGARFYAYGR